MNHSLDILSSGVKFILHLVHLMTKFELLLQEATKFFIYFWFQFVRMKSSKKLPAIYYVFIFWDIGLYYIFVSFEICTLNRKSFITYNQHIFWGITGMVLPWGYFLKCSLLLKELHQRFFELELEHCTLTESPLRRLILFHWYCNFNSPTRLNDLWYLWNAWYFS